MKNNSNKISFAISFVRRGLVGAFLTAVICSAIIVAQTPQPSATQVLPEQMTVPTEVRPTMILIPDVSRSVSASTPKMRAVMRQIINKAPANTTFGVVATGAQTEKRIFPNRDEVLAHVETVTANSKFTDLERGTDAALAVLQEIKASKPILLVYLTDGQISLPKEIQNKIDFKTVLTREFAPRPDVGVWVLNVAKTPLNSDGLPPNVKIVPLANWEEAERQMNETLATQINQQLIVSPPVPETTATPQSQIENGNLGQQIDFLIAGGLLLILTIGVFLLWRFWRRGKTDENSEIFEKDETIEQTNEIENAPVSLMRLEDLSAPQTDAAPRRVALVEFFDEQTARTERLFDGDACIVGNSTNADVRLPALKQAQTLELRFDGTNLNVFRLRPHTREIDSVVLDDGVAPIQFRLQPENSLKVGNLQITVQIVDEAVADILHKPVQKDFTLAASPKLSRTFEAAAPTTRHSIESADSMRSRRKTKWD